MTKRSFQEKGIKEASALALKNIIDLEKLIEWNIENKIQLYRMSSDMFPWMSEYELTDLPDFATINFRLQKIGKKVNKNNLRLTFHPGPFNVLASPNEIVVKNTLKELRQHGEIMDLLGLPRSPYAKINIHIGGVYGDKEKALERFIENSSKLSETAFSRLSIENDDKGNMFSVQDLLPVSKIQSFPIVFDYLHHQFCSGGLSEREAFLKAHSTWPDTIVPVVHYSSSKKLTEDPEASGPAHADYVYENINTYGKKVDVVLEAKAKERSILSFREQHKLI